MRGDFYCVQPPAGTRLHVYPLQSPFGDIVCEVDLPPRVGAYKPPSLREGDHEVVEGDTPRFKCNLCRTTARTVIAVM